MARFLLIHGSCHGAWCWRDMIPALAALGHQAKAIDLPGCGADRTPLGQITLTSTRDRIIAALEPDTVLVGHSWGGFPVTAAADATPDLPRGLIYISAYVPVSGQSMACMRAAGPKTDLSDWVTTDGPVYRFDRDKAKEFFYQDCPDEAVDYAVTRIGDQPIAPQTEPLILGDGLAQVPRAYVRTLKDRVVPTVYQQEMTKGWPAERLFTMNTSHSPFFADPEELAGVLSQIEAAF